MIGAARKHDEQLAFFFGRSGPEVLASHVYDFAVAICACFAAAYVAVRAAQLIGSGVKAEAFGQFSMFHGLSFEFC
jgi:hypothetical protein